MRPYFGKRMYAFGVRISQDQRARRESNPPALDFEGLDDTSQDLSDGSKLLENQRVTHGNRRLRVCTATVYSLCEIGGLAHVRLNSAIRVAESDLRRYLEWSCMSPDPHGRVHGRPRPRGMQTPSRDRMGGVQGDQGQPWRRLVCKTTGRLRGAWSQGRSRDRLPLLVERFRRDHGAEAAPLIPRWLLFNKLDKVGDATAPGGPRVPC